MYTSVTRNIRVTVTPQFVADQSDPSEGRFFWAYRVEIVNLSLERVQLKTRYWHITDERGRVQEVNGAGVVGEQPVIEPGGAFEYTSGCPLSTPTGMMMGHYGMVSAKGEAFPVEIPAFSLDSPFAKRVLN